MFQTINHFECYNGIRLENNQGCKIYTQLGFSKEGSFLLEFDSNLSFQILKWLIVLFAYTHRKLKNTPTKGL